MTTSVRVCMEACINSAHTVIEVVRNVVSVSKPKESLIAAGKRQIECDIANISQKSWF